MSDAEVAALRRTVAAAPGDDRALAALFAALDASGQPGTPEEAVARSNRAEALRRQSRLVEAEAEHRAALRWLPGFGGAHFNLGVLLQQTGRLSEAAERYATAAERMPGFAAAASNLGAVLTALGRAGEAEAASRRALALDPALVPARLNLGAALRDLGRLDEASSSFRVAAALRPEAAEAHANLGVTLRQAGDIAGSLAPLERALAVGLPDAGGVLAQIVQQRRHLGRWDGLADRSAALADLVRRGGTAQAHPWILLGEGLGPAVERAAAERYTAWRTRHLSPLPARPIGMGRLRVGYLSADFHDHATALLIAGVIERHDPAAVETVAYSYGPDDGGGMRRRLVAAFGRFADISGLGHEAAARRIAADGVDILVDLKGHTQGARPEILALRPAPVQVAWLGYPGTSGMPFIDYVLADAVVAPAGRHADFTERVVHLPGSYQPNERDRTLGPPPPRAACGLPGQGPLLCCFSAGYKITPSVFDVWTRLLRAVPEATLWLLDGPAGFAANLRREAMARGVDPARLVFAGRAGQPEHLARCRAADLFLDTWPVGAHTTASDALWAGLPMLTLLGDAFAGRVGASLLGALGLPELITASVAEYERTALDLMRDPVMLAALRRRLDAARGTASLFDPAAFARRLESAYAVMAGMHRRGEAPRSFAVP